MNPYNEFFLNIELKQKKFLKKGIFSFPLMFMGLFIAVKISTHNTGIYQSFFAVEDGPVEWGTSLVYFLASLVALSIAIKFCKDKSTTYGVLYLVLAVGLFLISMEEISWGQRIFSIQTPEYFKEHNDQGELTVHNLLGRYFLHIAYILVSFYGAFAKRILPKKIKTNQKELINLFVPDSFLYFYFLPAFAFYLYLDYISRIFYKFLGPDTIFGYGPGKFIMPKDQETVELVLALGFLCFVIINKYRQSRKRLIVGK